MTRPRADPIDGPNEEIFFQREAGSLEDDAIGDWTSIRRAMPGAVTLTSFDFKLSRPVTVMTPTLNKQGAVPHLEVFEYTGGYGFKDRNNGEMQSRLRMEEIEAVAKHFEASGNDRYSQAGRWFRLSGHFSANFFGGDERAREFLILEVHHSASNNYQVAGGGTPANYTNRLTCIRKYIPWRPGRGFNSTEPKIYGLQTALVVGPAGEEIFTDEYGRVRLQFHWDREGNYDEKSSAWVRVATQWSGPNFGMTSIPRIGTECIVQFLDGNPDRPIITGMVPSATTMPPWTLPANKTQSGILSRSTPNGGYENANALRFEDKKGQEQLWLHAEKDQLTEVENNEDKWVGNDRRKTVDHDETTHIKHDRTETVDHDETITVHNNRKERVDQNETISIGANRTEDVGENEKISIGENQFVTIGQNQTETVLIAKALTVGAGYAVTVGGAMNTAVGLAQFEEVGLNKTVMVGKKFSIKAGDELEIQVGKSRLLMRSDGRIELIGEEILLQGRKKVEVHGNDVDINPD
jgi:type VI secretion system secreted protein VgrG